MRSAGAGSYEAEDHQRHTIAFNFAAEMAGMYA
jgi:hypothetical protein